MYIRTPRALVWVESPLAQPTLAPKAAPTAGTPYQERWAKQPLNTAKGRCVAVRQNDGKLELGCMRNNHLVWLPDPHDVLLERQLDHWLRNGF